MSAGYVPDQDPMAPALPAGVIEATRDTTATTTPVIPKEYTAGIGQLEDLQTRDTARGAVEVINAERQKVVDAEKAQEELVEARARLAEQERANEEIALRQAEREQARKAEQMELRQLAEQEKGHKFETLYSKMSTGAKVLQGISLALGTFGAALGKTPNYALDIIQNAENSEFEHQKAELDKLRTAKLDKRQGNVDSEAAYERGLTEITGRSMGRLKAVEARLSAGLKKLGLDGAAIAADARTLGVQKMYADREAELLKGRQDMVAKSIGSTTTTNIKRTGEGAAGLNGKPTERQITLAGYAGTLENELKTIGSGSALTPEVLSAYQKNALAAEAADTTASKSMLGGGVVSVGRALDITPASKYAGLGPEAQKQLNAVDNAKEALARIRSGGAIPSAEDRMFADQLAPKAGDSPELIRQKIGRMREETARLKTLSGQAGTATANVGAREGTAPTAAPAKRAATKQDAAAAAELKGIINDRKATPEQKQEARDLLKQVQGQVN